MRIARAISLALVVAGFLTLAWDPVDAVPAEAAGTTTAEGSLASRVVGAAVSPTERAFFDAINKTRAAHGLGSVALDARLVESARLHSRDMVQGGYFQHGASWWRRLEAVGVTRGTVGEILGWYGHPAVAVAVPVLVKMWLQSPEHRRILLNPIYRNVGVGVAVGRFEGYSTAVVVTADFWSS